MHPLPAPDAEPCATAAPSPSFTIGLFLSREDASTLLDVATLAVDSIIATGAPVPATLERARQAIAAAIIAAHGPQPGGLPN